ncbi:MAG: hypothetical protein HRU38_10900 [Saccharospirillaceae bacterium]|nr:hypothetical protein [Saccharospirillaceae bacterium]
MNILEQKLQREFSHQRLSVNYNQDVTFELDGGYSIEFKFEGSCNWGVQSHDYCEDANFFTGHVNLKKIVKSGKELTVKDDFSDMIKSLVFSCINLDDDTRRSEEDEDFTGKIKISYESSKEVEVQLILVLEQLNDYEVVT